MEREKAEFRVIDGYRCRGSIKLSPFPPLAVVVVVVFVAVLNNDGRRQ